MASPEHDRGAGGAAGPGQSEAAPTGAVESRAEREARYARRDVLDKLGVAPGQAIRYLGDVDRNLAERAAARAGRAEAADGEPADLVLYWPRSVEDILSTLRGARHSIAPKAGVWLITSKRTARNRGLPVVPDVVAIELGKQAGLVDNKVCSVSETDTAMRFVIRRSDR